MFGSSKSATTSWTLRPAESNKVGIGCTRSGERSRTSFLDVGLLRDGAGAVTALGGLDVVGHGEEEVGGPAGVRRPAGGSCT